MKKTMTALLALAALAGCATQMPMGDVIPEANDHYQVIATGPDESYARKIALHTADVTCTSRKMRFVVQDQKTDYQGTVSEDTNKAINTAASFLATLSHKSVPTLSHDDDYKMTMTFTCQS